MELNSTARNVIILTPLMPFQFLNGKPRPTPKVPASAASFVAVLDASTVTTVDVAA